jgi:hypothetical protein
VSSVEGSSLSKDGRYSQGMGEKLCELVEHDKVTHRGWMFFCPACKTVHQVDHRWGWNGSKTEPTFTGSVLVHAVTHGTPEAPVHRPACHSQVTLGRISYYPDSGHEMKLKEVELPDWDERYKKVK